jgi:glycosyltransferase involved in cell wall biosynthesis
MGNIGFPGDATVVGAIGRLSPVKGFRYLISAFEEVASRDAKAHLLIIGEGPEKEILQKQILTSGVADRILLIARGAPLEKYLSLGDIYCVPSVNEGLGLSLMEAMAAGRACIASDVGGISELIINETDGILVPPEDPEALAAAILRLAADVRFRQQLAKNARRKAADNFSIIDSVAKTVKVYEEVIKTNEA